MKLARVVAVIALCLVLVEVGLGLQASSSKAKAVQLLQVVDGFRLGETSKAEAQRRLRPLGLALQDEPCSSSTGPCDGIGIELANYPEPSRALLASMFEAIAAKFSIFRPTYLVASFYFHLDRLSVATVTFSSDNSSIGTMLASTDSGQQPTSEWRRSNRTGGETFVNVLEPVHQQTASLSSSSLFDLGCMESFRGCKSEVELWPSIAQYKPSK